MVRRALTQHAIEKEVRSFLVESFLTDTEAASLESEDPLLDVLDSLQMLRMVLHLECRYSIAIDHSELTLENLGSINRIATFVHAKLSRR